MLSIIDTLLDDSITDSTRQKVKDTLTEVCKLAIKALEQQPSEDCISRQAVLDVINFEDKWLFDAKSHNADTHIAFSGLESRVKALPSVHPKYTDEEIDKIQAVEQAYVDKMVELAVEETKRPKGKWIEVEVRNVYATLKCSVCDRVIEPIFTFGEYSYEDIKRFYPYCHCGAEMSGGGEDET